MNVINKVMYKRTVTLIDTKSDDKVMDIGYGNGYLLKCLYNKTKSDLYGVDISSVMTH
jgi:ubiquinone/menaquinone biosynthesis C-methylase UbiE